MDTTRSTALETAIRRHEYSANSKASVMALHSVWLPVNPHLLLASLSWWSTVPRPSLAVSSHTDERPSVTDRPLPVERVCFPCFTRPDEYRNDSRETDMKKTAGRWLQNRDSKNVGGGGAPSTPRLIESQVRRRRSRGQLPGL